MFESTLCKAKAKTPSLLISLHPAPEVVPHQPKQWRLAVSSYRLPDCPELTQLKTTSRLFYVLAKSEADRRGFDDAILLNHHGRVAEAISSNIFWIRNNVVYTPPLETGALPGTTRDLVLKLLKRHGYRTSETSTTLATLKTSQGVFLSVSTSGIIEVVQLEQKKVKQHPLVKQIHAWVEEHHKEAVRAGARKRST